MKSSIIGLLLLFPNEELTFKKKSSFIKVQLDEFPCVLSDLIVMFCIIV
jgi:hypothetical protein